MNDVFSRLKQVNTDGNLLLPKEYVRKLLLMNMLIMQEKQKINQTDIFKYIKDNGFELPSAWESLDLVKQEKFLVLVKELINLMEKN